MTINFIENKRFEIIAPEFNTELSRERIAPLIVLAEAIRRKLFLQDFNEKSLTEFVKSSLKKAQEIERMVNALEKNPKHPELRGFVRNGLYLERETEKGLLKIYFPNGQGFLKDILERLEPAQVRHFPPTSKDHKGQQQKLKDLSEEVEKKFKSIFDTFSRILKRQSISATRWHEKTRSLETCEIFLGDL